MIAQDHKLRIAILAHSTSPRGGVVHALELGDALTRLGHEAVVHAPDAHGTGFFRPALCRTIAIPVEKAKADLAEMVGQRVADYRRHFATPGNRAFDVFHAQDSISGNALASLKELGLIGGFARTVHHVDSFADPRLTALQARAIAAADAHFVVSRLWQAHLRGEFSVDPHLVGNGVDPARYSPTPSSHDDALRQRLGVKARPVFLSVGGIEERKNTIRILRAFNLFRQTNPTAQLVIAGGASLLDHSAYRHDFEMSLAQAGLPQDCVIVTGPLPQADMPSLYRIADALVFASVKEGFGLAVLEAMASGLPVILSRISPFTEYATADDASWCDPFDVASIAKAMAITLSAEHREKFLQNGARLAARHDWRGTARAHLGVYAKLKEAEYA